MKQYTEEQVIKALKETFGVCHDNVLGVDIELKRGEGYWQEDLVRDFMVNLNEQ